MLVKQNPKKPNKNNLKNKSKINKINQILYKQIMLVNKLIQTKVKR